MKILILGCGWVGEELARYAITKGCIVTGTTTHLEKYQKLLHLGIQPVVHDFDREKELILDVPSFDFVLNSIPAPKKTDTLVVSKRFEQVAKTLQSISFKKHIYLSSVGIYPDTSELFRETDTADADLDKTLLIAEERMRQLPGSVVYRLGGLFGKERIFAKYFQDKVCTTGDQLANFIHVEDVVRLTWLGFQASLQRQVYNIVAPEHPPKRSVIEKSAAKYGLRPPKAFEPQDSFQKIVDGRLIADELDYNYRYPSPLVF